MPTGLIFGRHSIQKYYTIITININSFIFKISFANIKSHTEPIFKLYNLLKIEDIYKSKLLILYYKILKLSSARYFDTFIPKN